MREKLIELLNEVHRTNLGKEYRERLGTIADHLIANGVTFATDNNAGSRWIPVTERLPEKNVDVLVFNGSYFYVAQYYTWHIGSIDIDRWSMPQYSANPTHWIPLPEAPKEVE